PDPVPPRRRPLQDQLRRQERQVPGPKRLDAAVRAGGEGTEGLRSRAGLGFAMPTVLRSGPYRVYFYSHEPNEPTHVHVDRERFSAKYWLQDVSLARNFGFSPKELRKILRLLRDHQAELLEAWHGHLGAGG